jgi:drug/metabolite transporter (DMT)-like permease
VRATVITYVNPMVAAVLGVLVLGEVLAPPMILGFTLVIAGSVLATRRPAGPTEPAQAGALAAEAQATAEA